MTPRDKAEAGAMEPCPFCASAAVKSRDGKGYGCSNAGCYLWGYGEGVLADQWQSRPLESALKSQLAAMEARQRELVDAIYSRHQGFCNDAHGFHEVRCMNDALTISEREQSRDRERARTSGPGARDER